MSVEQGIHARLSGDAELVALCTSGQWQGAPPEGTEPPYLKWQLLGGSPDHTFTQKRMDDLSVQFYTWAEDTDDTEGVAAARDIMDRLEVVLTDAPLSVSGRILLYCRKERDLPDLVETMEGGSRRYGKGQQWRLVVS